MGYDNDARRRNRYVGSVVSLFEKLASLPLLLLPPPRATFPLSTASFRRASHPRGMFRYLNRLGEIRGRGREASYVFQMRGEEINPSSFADGRRLLLIAFPLRETSRPSANGSRLNAMLAELFREQPAPPISEFLVSPRPRSRLVSRTRLGRDRFWRTRAS